MLTQIEKSNKLKCLDRDLHFNVVNDWAPSWSKENGIGLTQTSYSTVRPIDFYCEVPEEIRRGECVGK